MVSVETYFGTPGKFLAMADWRLPPSDPSYIEGAIVLRINGIQVLGLEEWDDVNWLWSYIINVLEDLDSRPEASTDFPDQPLLLKFVRRPAGKIAVEVSHNSVVLSTAEADMREFLLVLEDAGANFFERLAEVIPEESTIHLRDRDRIKAAAARLLGSSQGP